MVEDDKLPAERKGEPTICSFSLTLLNQKG